MALHERAIEAGEKVTLARLSGYGVISGRVVRHTTDGAILVRCPGASLDYYVEYADEGVDWIRGWARDGTPAAEALLGAFKLSRMHE